MQSINTIVGGQNGVKATRYWTGTWLRTTLIDVFKESAKDERLLVGKDHVYLRELYERLGLGYNVREG